jgi:hypothetical protein
MTQVFISYARQDQDFARKLAHDLESAGLDVWIDFQDITPGTRWDSAIDQALNEADFMVLIISPDSVESAEVAAEWWFFLDEHKPVVPVLLRPTETPFRLRRMQYIDFHSQNYETAFNQLLTAIQDRDFRVSPEEARVQQQRLDDAIQSAQRDLEGILAQPEKPAEPRPSAVELLAEARRHHKNGVLKKAVEVYARILLDRGDPEPRVQAVQALGEMRAASPDLLQSLEDDPAPPVRKARSGRWLGCRVRALMTRCRWPLWSIRTWKCGSMPRW